jgi:hypothetical protein
MTNFEMPKTVTYCGIFVPGLKAGSVLKVVSTLNHSIIVANRRGQWQIPKASTREWIAIYESEMC